MADEIFLVGNEPEIKPNFINDIVAEANISQETNFEYKDNSKYTEILFLNKSEAIRFRKWLTPKLPHTIKPDIICENNKYVIDISNNDMTSLYTNMSSHVNKVVASKQNSGSCCVVM